MQEMLVVGETTIPYEIRPSKKAQRIRITITRGQVRVSLPKGVSLEAARDFVELKKEWIFRHWELQSKQAHKVREFISGEYFPYLGREFLLLIKDMDIISPLVELQDNTITIYLPKLGEDREYSHYAREVLLKWYQEQAIRILEEKLVFFSQLMGVQYKRFRLKEQRTRWGSCSSKGGINLNWRIVLAPDPVIDYLVLHELAHLKQMNHSPDFWSLIEKHQPDYQAWKKWLRQHGRALFF